jgi:hypothetical protein
MSMMKLKFIENHTNDIAGILDNGKQITAKL